MTKITRSRTVRADTLHDGVLLDFEDGEPGMVSEVQHMAHSVLFTARGTQFRLERDEQVTMVTRMQLVQG